MARAIKYSIPLLIALHLIWQYLAGGQSLWRDLLLYNLIWILVLISILIAPLTFDRVALAAIALAIFFWGIGSLATSVDQLMNETPTFTVASQVAYTLFYPLILLAIPRLTTTTSKLRPLELLDSLIFGLGFTSIVATMLVVFLFPADSLSGSSDYFLIFYPVGDLALLLISITNLVTHGINRQKVLFATGVSIFAVTDFYYLWLAINHRYSFGSIADLGWLIAITFIAIAVSLPQKSHGAFTPIHPAIVALSIFVSPVLLAISALKPEIFPLYILIPSVANLLLAFIRMSTALREARSLTSERLLARTDELTGLANRRRLLAELDAFSQVEGALLLMDLNEFKPVNDQHGHDVGDLILREVAARFSRALPNGSLLARLGGDEFGVLLRGNSDETLEIAFALRASLSYPIKVRGLSITVGVSIGHVHNDGAGSLLQRADSAMYRAKSSDVGVVQS